MKEFTTAKGLGPDEFLNKNGFIPEFWREIFVECEEVSASDIIIQQFKNTIRIRARIHGVCRVINEQYFEEQIQKSVIDFFKQMCNLDLSNNKKAQDKCFELNLTKSRYRLALAPTPTGEFIVLRIIRDDFIPRFKDCNLDPQTERDLRWSLAQTKGLICITGPTGSGKSSTLQACLMEIDRIKKNVITIEDPVEKQIPDTAQCEITPYFSWSTSIKMAMRQNPDIILIGEIRDPESASLALSAAQTGHLVLTTLHTNDVAGTIDRLIDLGVERHLIAENLLFISAQRLLSKICPHCAIPYEDSSYYYQVGLGCDQCSSMGVIGRIPIVEYSLRPSPLSIHNFNKEDFIKTELKKSLLTEGRILAKKGTISYSELISLGEDQLDQDAGSTEQDVQIGIHENIINSIGSTL